jgi:hypothetical protein
MNKSCILLTAAALSLLATRLPLAAQTFDAPNDGSYGAMNITADTTLDLPPDGVFRCTTITIGPNVTLRFNRNALSTPVYLLATGDILIQGAINLSGGNNDGALPGTGGPGGFDGGFGGFGQVAPANQGGDGHGPGYGRDITSPQNHRGGVYAKPNGGNTNVYGNSLIMPLIGGSGGAGYDGNPGGGGGGGGAILLASPTEVTITGSIAARGGYGPWGGGSGGAVRVIAPVVTGNGYLDVRANGRASDGRIRPDCTDRLAYRNLSLFGVSSRGNRMQVYPASLPKLRFIEAAGQAIAEDAGAAVTVTLPAGSPAEQAVKLRALGFTGQVPVRVVVPEHSASTSYDITLDASATLAEATLNVTLIPGEPTRIEA